LCRVILLLLLLLIIIILTFWTKAVSPAGAVGTSRRRSGTICIRRMNPLRIWLADTTCPAGKGSMISSRQTEDERSTYGSHYSLLGYHKDLGKHDYLAGVEEGEERGHGGLVPPPTYIIALPYITLIIRIHTILT
jgi:hypothetical protein